MGMSPRPLGTSAYKRMVTTGVADVVPSEHYDSDALPLPLDHERDVVSLSSSSLLSPLSSLSSSSTSPTTKSGEILIPTTSITPYKNENNTSSSNSTKQICLPLKKRTLLPFAIDPLSSSSN